MFNRYCRFQSAKDLTNDKMTPVIDLRYIDFPFDGAWFIQHAQYWSANLDFEVRARPTRRVAFARILFGCHSVQLFAAHLRSRPILQVAVVCFGWSDYTSRRLLGIRTPPMLAYYSNTVLRTQAAQCHSFRVIALIEVVVCTAMRFLLAMKDGFHRRVLWIELCG